MFITPVREGKHTKTCFLTNLFRILYAEAKAGWEPQFDNPLKCKSDSLSHV